MYEFSPEHLERLQSKLAFKYAVRDHILEKLKNSTTEVGDFDSKYVAQLAKAPLLGKLNLDIQELEASIEMLKDFMA